MNIPAFCSFDFLMNFLQQNTVDLFMPGVENETISRLQLHDLILNGLTLQTDVSKEKIDANLINPYVAYLVKTGRIRPNENAFKNLKLDEDGYFKNQTKINGLYLLSAMFQNEKLRSLQEKSGSYFLGASMNMTHLFEDEIFDLTSNEFITWAFLKNVLTPHHSMVIADPYLLKERTANACIEYLKEVLPKNIKTSYHLSLIASSKTKGGLDIDKNEINLAKQVILNTVLKVIPNAIVETFIVNKSEFHDRVIITNNVMIYSGSGFDAINRYGAVTKDSYWVAARSYKRLNHNGIKGVFYMKVIQEKLERFKQWISSQEVNISKNPLLN